MSTVPASWARRRTPLVAHAPFIVALLAGVALRVVVLVAYRPALLFPDSFGYLGDAHDFEITQTRPGGYSLFLKPITAVTDPLTAVSAFQHVLGLGLAVAVYVFLLRRRIPRWAATLATLPLLLDPLQLVLEHYVLSDLLFEVVLVVACLILLWHRRPGHVAMVAVGFLAAGTGLVRGAGSAILLVFLAAVVCLRLPWHKIAVFLVGAAIPLVPYVMAFHAAYGSYAVSDAGPRFLYARIAPKVYCPGVQLPRYEKPLCPKQPLASRPSTDYFMWGRHRAPQWQVQPPPGLTQLQMVKDFDKRVIRAEPAAYAKAVLFDLAGGFAPTRTYEVPGYPASYWLFADHYWSMDRWLHSPTLGRQPALQGTSVDPGAARFLTAYRHWLWTPGPLLGVLLVAAAGAVVGTGRTRRSGDRVAVGLLAGCCFVTIATGAAVSGFSWRYQLPQLPLLPAAGVLAVAALIRGRAPGSPPPAQPLRVLDRSARGLTRLVPAAWRPALRRAADRGTPQVAIALVAGLLLGAVSALLLVRSGWVAHGPAWVGGLAVAAVVVVVLLVARARSRADGTPSDRGSDSSGDRSPDVVLTRR